MQRVLSPFVGLSDYHLEVQTVLENRGFQGGQVRTLLDVYGSTLNESYRERDCPEEAASRILRINKRDHN